MLVRCLWLLGVLLVACLVAACYQPPQVAIPVDVTAVGTTVATAPPLDSSTPEAADASGAVGLPPATPTAVATRAPGSPTAQPTALVAPVVLGMLAPLSGGDAANGVQARQGAELGLVQLNRGGGLLGRPMGLRLADSTGSREDVAARYLAMPADGAAAILLVAPNSTVLNLTPQLRTAQSPTFVTAGAPVLTRQGIPWVLRLLPDEDRLARSAAAFAHERLSGRRIAVLYSNDDFGVGSFRAGQLELRDRLRTEVVGAVPLALSGGDVPAALDRLRSLNPDVTLVYARPGLLALVMRQVRAQPVPGQFMTTGEATSQGALDTFTPGDADGWYAATAPLPTLRQDRLAREFTTAYRAAYRSEPDITAAAFYDGVGIVAEGIRRARSVDPEAVLKGLQSIVAYDGVLGRYGYNTETHDGLQDIVLVRFDGRSPAVVTRP